MKRLSGLAIQEHAESDRWLHCGRDAEVFTDVMRLYRYGAAPVSYRDVCEHPGLELERIREFMALHGAPTRRIRTVPESFAFSHGCKIDQNNTARCTCLEELAGRA